MTKYSFCDDMTTQELIRFLDGLEELIDEWKENLDPEVYKKYKVYVELTSKLKIAKEREKYLKHCKFCEFQLFCSNQPEEKEEKKHFSWDEIEEVL